MSFCVFTVINVHLKYIMYVVRYKIMFSMTIYIHNIHRQNEPKNVCFSLSGKSVSYPQNHIFYN